jgi:ATP adenylyltransferase
MEHIWSPWRYSYIKGETRQQSGCVFCRIPSEPADEDNYVVHRGRLNYIILNLFPYTSGHIMVVPYEHQPSLISVDEATSNEMTNLTKQALQALDAEYHPEGFNVGMNIGVCAGAGIAEHLHMHVVPRWNGDANFMSVIGETRVLPEELGDTFKRLKKHFP